MKKENSKIKIQTIIKERCRILYENKISHQQSALQARPWITQCEPTKKDKNIGIYGAHLSMIRSCLPQHQRHPE